MGTEQSPPLAGGVLASGGGPKPWDTDLQPELGGETAMEYAVMWIKFQLLIYFFIYFKFHLLNSLVFFCLFVY